MKNIFVAIYLLMGYSIVYSQENQKDLSNADRFFLKTGVILEKKFIDIGKLANIDFQILIIKDIHNKNEIRSLRLHYIGYTGVIPDNAITTLDIDELDDLINLVKLIRDKISSLNPENYIEYIYRSRSGFTAGCYYSKQKRNLSEWVTFLKMTEIDKQSTVFIYPEDLEKLINILTLAKEKI